MHALRNSLVITFGSIAIFLAVLCFLFLHRGSLKMLYCRLLTSRPGKIVLGLILYRTPKGTIAGFHPLRPLNPMDPEESLRWLVISSAVISGVFSTALAYLLLRFVAGDYCAITDGPFSNRYSWE